MSHDPSHPPSSVKALMLAITTAAVLALVKFSAALLTHSMALMASALDSLLDMASSSVNLFASIKAAKPPDESHDYGHEKIESLASLFQSMLILISGIFLVVESTKRLVHGSYVQEIGVGIGVMIFSIILTFILTRKLHATARENKSLILHTENLHYTMDLLTNGGAILALIFVRMTGVVFIDLLVSIGIAVYILKTAFGILRHAVDELLDRSLPVISREDISQIILGFSPKIVNFHNFRSRQAGTKIFLDFHVEIRGETDFKKAHNLTEGLIRRIKEKYPEADITVHYDPEGAE
jgi:ferrous-iron efflux pump FieF